MALNYVTITGTFEDGTGAGLNGTVTFTPSETVYSAGVPVVSVSSPITAEVINGTLHSPSGGTLQLLATDNAGLSLEGLTGFWYWTVTVSVGGSQSWAFFLPHSPATVDLYSLANTTAGGGGSGTVTSVSVVTANGFSGSVATPGTTPAITLQIAAAIVPVVTALTDAATIAVNAALGNDFRVTLGGNRTMGAPSNPADGQDITFLLTQDGTGSRTVTWNAVYDFGAAGAPTLSTTAGKRDLVAFKYVAAASAWVYMGSQLGF